MAAALNGRAARHRSPHRRDGGGRITALVAEPLAAVPLAAVGWLMVTGFSRPPYADLRPTGQAAADAAIVIGATALGSAAAGTLFRWSAMRFTLEGVSAGVGRSRPGHGAGPVPAESGLTETGPAGPGWPGTPVISRRWPSSSPSRPRTGRCGRAPPGPGRSAPSARCWGCWTLTGLPLLTLLLVAAGQRLNLADDLLLFLLRW